MKSAVRRQAEFRRRLAEARSRALEGIGQTREEIVTREPHQPGSVWEDAATQASTDTLSRIEGRERHELDEIAAAQARLESGAYGVCETCGRTIALARLRALPTARRCKACESAAEPRVVHAASVAAASRGLTPIGRLRPTGATRLGFVAPSTAPATKPETSVAPRRVGRRRRRATVAVSKGTTLFQADRGPRAAWPASPSRRKKR